METKILEYAKHLCVDLSVEISKPGARKTMSRQWYEIYFVINQIRGIVDAVHFARYGMPYPWHSNYGRYDLLAAVDKLWVESEVE